MEEASLENVAAEKVSLSKIASGPCVRNRSFHRAFIEASKSIHLDVSLSQCSAVLFSSVTFGILKKLPIDANILQLSDLSKFLEHFEQTD